MNTLSVRKLQELLYQQRHKVIESFVCEKQIYYVLVLCEKYRNFFMIDLTSLPIPFEDRSDEYIVTPIHNTRLPELSYDAMSSLYSHHINDENIPKHFRLYLQKHRMDKVPFLIHSYLKLCFFGSTYMMYLDNVFQIEHVRHPQDFTIYCVSVDDYYIHQSTISQDLFNAFEKLFDFIQQNVVRQSNVLCHIFKNTTPITQSIQYMNQELAKFQRYSSIISSLYTRATLTKRHSVLNMIIEIMYTIFRTLSEYLLHLEHKFYTLTVHSRMILSETGLTTPKNENLSLNSLS